MIFSVIVPFLNEEKHIERCIFSLLDQDIDKKSYEIIFVDNGSTDGSVAIVKRFQQIILLSEKRKGEYYARNTALRVAKGNIIAFTDGDCVVSRNWLSELQGHFQNTEIGIVLGERQFADRHGVSLQVIADYENMKISYVLSQSDRSFYYGYANNLAIRGDVFHKTGLFRTEPINGDTEIVHRFIEVFPDKKVIYDRSSSIRHLEVDSLSVWLRKVIFYGEQNALLQNESSFRQLNMRQNLSVFVLCAKQYRYNLRKIGLGILVLITGKAFYLFGELKLRLQWG